MKTRLLRRLYREQKRLLEEELKFLANGRVSDSERRHLEGHAERVRMILTRLMPRQPLDWVALFVRVGIAVLLFIVLVAPPFTYLRIQYLAPPMRTESSAGGTVSVREYVPEIPVSVAANLWTRRDVSGPAVFTHAKDLRGMTAGIVPASRSGEPGVAVFWTEPKGDKRILRKLVTDDFFRPVTTRISTLWDDRDFTSAIATSNASSTLVAAAYRDSDGGRAVLQSFGFDGIAHAPRVEIVLQTDEAVDDIQAVPWGEGWALTTRVPREPNASLFDPVKIRVRVLDTVLRVKETIELPISGYEIGEFPIVLPKPSGYVVLATAHPSIRSNGQSPGDRLYAFQFSSSKSLNRVLRLTDVGGQHDVGTTGFAELDQGDIVVGVQNIPGSSFDDPTVAYPTDSGRAYLRFFDSAFQISGTLIVFDEPTTKDALDRRGVSHMRQVQIGNRMYVAFDMINANSSEANGPNRSVQAMWLHLSR